MVNLNLTPIVPNSLSVEEFLTGSIENQIDVGTINIDQADNIDQIYKKYKDNNYKTKSNKILNKTKIFFIAKSIQVNGKEIMVAVPINNFDDLSNSPYAKSLSARVGTFQMRTFQDLNKKGLKEGMPGNRPFILEHALESEGPYNNIPEIPLDALIIPNEEDTAHLSDEEKQLLARSKWKLESEYILDDKGREKILYQYYMTEYEYDYTFLDNTIFTNVEPYSTDPRNRKSYKKTFTDKLNNLKSINLDDIWGKGKKSLPLLELEDVFLKNTDESLSKNIIPIFFDSGEAQELLLTVLEEVLEPFKKSICFVNILEYDEDTFPKIENIDHIDDSFTLNSRLTFPNTRIEIFKDWLVRHRLIKPVTGLKKKSHYENYMEDIDHDILADLGEVVVDDFFNPNDYCDYKKFKSDFNNVLLKNASKTKIVSMGLGDFLNFWNNNDIKNGEVLFIPSSENIKKLRVPFSSKKPVDRLYEYQQRFRRNNNQDLDNYTYEIKSLN